MTKMCLLNYDAYARFKGTLELSKMVENAFPDIYKTSVFRALGRPSTLIHMLIAKWSISEAQNERGAAQAFVPYVCSSQTYNVTFL